MTLSVLTSSTDFDSLAPSQLLTLALLAVAVRPFLEDPSAEFLSFKRRDLRDVLRAAGLRMPVQRFTALLEELAGTGAHSPAVRLIRHAGAVRVILGRPRATSATEEAWRNLLVSQRLRGLGLTLRSDLHRAGFDTSEALPASLVVAAVPAIAPDALRCVTCDHVRPATAFGTHRGRIRSACSACA